MMQEVGNAQVHSNRLLARPEQRIFGQDDPDDRKFQMIENAILYFLSRFSWRVLTRTR